jgi:hypothetical protein
MDRRLFSFLKPLRWIKGRNFEAHTNNVAITTNDMSRKNLVSYAEGTLDYRPAAHSGGTVAFTSADDKVTQYFSDRRHAAGGFVTQLFDASQTDPLTVSIEQLGNDSDWAVAVPHFVAFLEMAFERPLRASSRSRDKYHLRGHQDQLRYDQPLQSNRHRNPVNIAEGSNNLLEVQVGRVSG